MKKLIACLGLLVHSLVAYSQSQLAYSAINETENFILDRYSIDYTGPHTRHMVVNNAFSSSIDPSIKESMVNSFDRFVAWSSGRLSTIPDTSKVLMTLGDFLSDKLVPDFYHIAMNVDLNIIQKYIQEVNDYENNIKTIEIIETFNSSKRDRIEHLIFIEKYDGIWEIITPDYSITSLTCPQCPTD